MSHFFFIMFGQLILQLTRNLCTYVTEILKLYEKCGIEVETEGRTAGHVEFKCTKPIKCSPMKRR